MPTERKLPRMLIPTIIMAVVALILFIIAVRRGQGEHLIGIRSAVSLLIEIMPLLVFALLIAGFIQVLLPHDLIGRWVGTEAGMRGILIGTLAGGLTPGGPYVSMPIVAGLLRAGAGTGTMVAFLTSWSLWAVARLPMEVGILGWRFTAVRMLSTLIFPPLAGVLANIITKLIP